MKKSLVPFLLVLTSMVLGCSNSVQTSWTLEENHRINKVLNGSTIPFYNLGANYSMEFTEQPVDSYNSVLISNEEKPNNFNIRYYIRAVEAAGYTGLKSYDELILFYREDIPTLFAAGVYSEEVEKQLNDIINSALILLVTLGILSFTDFALLNTFDQNTLDVNNVFIYAMALEVEAIS